MTWLPILPTLIALAAIVWLGPAYLARKRSRRSSYRPAPIAAPDWTEADRDAWDKFLKSPAGVSLWRRARAFEAHVAIRNAQDQFHTPHSAGRTAGTSDTLNWLESLSRVAGDQATPTEQPPEGEAELLDRLSP